MLNLLHRKKLYFVRDMAAKFLLVCFFVTTMAPLSIAQEIFLPAPGTMVPLSPSFAPPMLKGIKVYPDNPFLFDFILDNGQGGSGGDTEEAGTLVKYFLASLTTPENDMWVNLSPYEKDRIVPESFGQTEMGRDLLAQDYILKQITASLIYPEDELGKKFWDRVYAEAKKKFGTTDIPVNTFNKVWIVPAKAVVYENPQSASAYVIDSKLKVMLEEDYLALQKSEAPKVDDKQTSAIGNQIVREIVIPALTKEVNEGKNFSQLRQIYNSLILASWYKKKIKDSILAQVYVDKNKVAGVDIDDPQEKQQIYERYLEAFKKGAYNYIKEEADPVTKDMIPKKYFSGGFSATRFVMDTLEITSSSADLSGSSPIENGKILQIKLASSPLPSIQDRGYSLPTRWNGNSDWMTPTAIKALWKARSDKEWVAVGESEDALRAIRRIVTFNLDDYEYTLNSFLQLLNLGSEFQENRIRDGGGVLIIRGANKDQIPQVQAALNALARSLRNDEDFNRAYEVKVAEPKEESHFPDMLMTQRISFIPRDQGAVFDSRIPVAAISLNLTDPDLKELKPDVNGEKPAFGDIYFYPEQFNSAGYFYKILRAAPKATTRVKLYGQEYEDDFTEEVLQEAMIKEANFIKELNLANVHGIPQVIERGITSDGRIYIKLKGLPKSESLLGFKGIKDYPLVKKIVLLRRLADIYTAIQAVGIAHFDIKIENIIIDPLTEEPMVIDFGVSKQANLENFAEDIRGFEKVATFVLGEEDVGKVRDIVTSMRLPWFGTKKFMYDVAEDLAEIELELSASSSINANNKDRAQHYVSLYDKQNDPLTREYLNVLRPDPTPEKADALIQGYADQIMNSFPPGVIAGADMVVGMPPSQAENKTVEYLAGALAKLLTTKLNKVVSANSSVLVKTRETREQKSLPADERAANVADAFRVIGDVKGRTVLLLDDIQTTGYTIKEATRVLKEAGAEVISLALLQGDVARIKAVASSGLEDDRSELLASVEDRFEKPYAQLVQKPERELNENVAEKTSAAEIQMEIDQLIPQIDSIIFGHENPGLQAAEELRDRESEFLQALRSLSMDIRVSVHDELEFIGLSRALKELRASRNRIYYAIEKADRDGDAQALKDLNQQAIRNNRLVLKAQLLLAAKMFEDRLSLKNSSFIYYAARETLRGALNSAQMLEEELGYRIGRLQAAKMVRQIETADWLGNIVRTFRLSGFDIKVAPGAAEGQEPAVTIRQQHYINVHTRLDQTLTDIRQGRIAAAQTQLDLLRDIYRVDPDNIYERYSEISERLRAIRAKTAALSEGQVLRRSSPEAKAFADDIEELKALVEVPKMRIWMDVNFEEGIDSAFRGYIHRFAGYIQEIGTISRNKATLEFFASKLKAAEKAHSLSQRNLAIIVDGMAPIVEWAGRGFVFEKQRVEIKLDPAVEKIKAGDYEGAQTDIALAVTQLQARLNEIEKIVGNSKRQAASVFAAFRDKDMNRRAGAVSALLDQNKFAEGFRELEMLIELYFNQDQVEPGYVRAATSLHKAVGKIRAMQRSSDPSYLIKQAKSLLRLAQQDVEHKYSLKVYALVDGKRRFSYIAPGTTLLGYLRSKKLDPRTVQVSLGKGWLDFDELRRAKLEEEKTITINTSSSAITETRRQEIVKNADDFYGQIKNERRQWGGSFFTPLMMRMHHFESTEKNFKLIQAGQFRPADNNWQEEVRLFAQRLSERWNTKDSDEEGSFRDEYGSIFRLMALSVNFEYNLNVEKLRVQQSWLQAFLSAADPKEQAQVLAIIVVDNITHLRGVGLHLEKEDGQDVSHDSEILFGKKSYGYVGTLRKFIDLFQQLDTQPAFSVETQEVIDQISKQPKSIKSRDIMLWTLAMGLDASVHFPEYYEDQQEFKDALARVKAKYGDNDYMAKSLRDSLSELGLFDEATEKLFLEALTTTDEQWAAKGLVPPYQVQVVMNSLHTEYGAEFFSSDFDRKAFSFLLKDDENLLTGDQRAKAAFYGKLRHSRNQIAWGQMTEYPQIAQVFQEPAAASSAIKQFSKTYMNLDEGDKLQKLLTGTFGIMTARSQQAQELLKLIPELAAFRKTLDKDNYFDSRAYRDSAVYADVAQNVIGKYGIKTTMVTRQISGRQTSKNKPFEHTYFEIEMSGWKFILDITPEQFGLEKAGIILVPQLVIKNAPQRYWMYSAGEIVRAAPVKVVQERPDYRQDGPPKVGGTRNNMVRLYETESNWRRILKDKGVVFPRNGEGMHIVIIGPGEQAFELPYVRQMFPGAKQIDIIDKIEQNPIYRAYLASRGIRYFEQSIAQPVEDIRDADLVLAFNVFDVSWFSPDNLKSSSDNISAMLKPGGIFVTNVNSDSRGPVDFDFGSQEYRREWLNSHFNETAFLSTDSMREGFLFLTNKEQGQAASSAVVPAPAVYVDTFKNLVQQIPPADRFKIRKITTQRIAQSDLITFTLTSGFSLRTVKVRVTADEIRDLSYDDLGFSFFEKSGRSEQLMAVVFAWLLDSGIFPQFKNIRIPETTGGARKFFDKLTRKWKKDGVDTNGLMTVEEATDPIWKSINIDPAKLDKDKIKASISAQRQSSSSAISEARRARIEMLADTVFDQIKRTSRLSEPDFWHFLLFDLKKVILEENYQLIRRNEFEKAGENWGAEVRYFAQRLDARWRTKTANQKTSFQDRYGSIFPIVTLSVSSDDSVEPRQLRLQHNWLYEFLAAGEPAEQAKSLWTILVSNVIHMREIGEHREGDERGERISHDVEILFGREGYRGAIAHFIDVFKQLDAQPDFAGQLVAVWDPVTSQMKQIKLRDAMLGALAMSMDASIHYPRHYLQYAENFSETLAQIQADQEALPLMVADLDQSIRELESSNNDAAKYITESMLVTDAQWKEKGFVAPVEATMGQGTLRSLYFYDLSSDQFSVKLFSPVLTGTVPKWNLMNTADVNIIIQLRQELNRLAWSQMDRFPGIAAKFKAEAAATASSSIIEAAPLSPEAKRRVGDKVFEIIGIFKMTRSRAIDSELPGFQAVFYKDTETEDPKNPTLPQRFRRSFQEITDKDERKIFAAALNAEWQRLGLDKDFGSVFEYVAHLMSDYRASPSQIKAGYEWFYDFLEAAPLLERTLALRLLVVGFNNHMRSGGLHVENESQELSLARDSYPLDAELMLGNDRELKGPQILQRYILSLLELQQTPQWTEVIPASSGKANNVGLTYEDMFLWALILAVDPTVYGEGYANYPVNQLEAYLSRYFNEVVEIKRVGVKFIEKALNHPSISSQDQRTQIRALFQKAFNVTDQQWADKGQRSPFYFVLNYDYLSYIFRAASYWTDKPVYVLKDPMLMLGFDLRYLPKKMWPEFTMPPAELGRHKTLWQQDGKGLRPLYAEAYAEKVLAGILPGLTITASAAVVQPAMIFPGGGKLFTEYAVTEDFLKNSDGKQRLSDDAAGQLKMKPSGYEYLTTPLKTVDHALGVGLVDKIAELDDQRTRSGSLDQTITVLYWGAGGGAALVDIKSELEKRGIRNIRLVGFGDAPHRDWLTLPAGIDMIFGKDLEIGKYFAPGEIDMIFSYAALNYLSDTKYYRQLAELLKPGGKIFWDGQAEDVQNVAATGLKWGFEYSPVTVTQRAYYLQKPATASSALAPVAGTANKGGIDFNANNLNLETQTSGPLGEIKFQMDPQQLRELQNVPGFTPVIINIQPMINVRMFLGLKEQDETPLAISKVQ